MTFIQLCEFCARFGIKMKGPHTSGSVDFERVNPLNRSDIEIIYDGDYLISPRENKYDYLDYRVVHKSDFEKNYKLEEQENVTR
jgi:hypothetical protein